MSPPDPEDETQEPVSRGASKMDPHERQFWDLDDDEGSLDELKDDEATPASPAPAKTETPEHEKAAAEPETSDEESPADEEEDSDEDSGEASEGPVDWRSGSQLEKISLIAFGLVLVGLGIWVAALFLGDLPTDDPNAPAEMPVQGKNVTLRDIATYWREPQTETDRGIQAGVKIIPAAELVLKKRDGKGALRIFFEDNDGGLTGDPVTLTFSNGTFSANGKDRIEAYCTEGFSNLGDFPAYVTGQIEPWFLIVKEGPGAKARGNEFKEIVRTPILPEKR